MHRHVLVTLFKTFVLANKLQVVPADNDSAVHLHFSDNTSEDASTDGNITSEWAFFVDVGAKNSLLGGFISQTNGLHVASVFFSKEFLLLISSFNLICMNEQNKKITCSAIACSKFIQKVN